MISLAPRRAHALSGTRSFAPLWRQSDADILYVNDPGFTVNNYSLKTVVGWRLFNVSA